MPFNAAGLSQAVAVLIDEGPATFEATNRAGFRYFTSVAEFKFHVKDEVLAIFNGAATTNDVFGSLGG